MSNDLNMDNIETPEPHSSIIDNNENNNSNNNNLIDNNNNNNENNTNIINNESVTLEKKEIDIPVNNNNNNTNNNNIENEKNLVNEFEDSTQSDYSDEYDTVIPPVPVRYLNNNNNNVVININKIDKNKSDLLSEDRSDFQDSVDEELTIPEIQDYSDMVVSILIPVTITMIILVATIRAINNKASWVSLTPLVTYEVDKDSSSENMVFSSIINSLIFLGIIILSTVIMVVLYRFRFMKALYGWMMGTSILLLGVFGGFLFIVVMSYLNLSLDYISFLFILWNFVFGGVICIFWYAPKYLNQTYLISVSVLMALSFSRLPEWTTWAILAIVSIYDIFAVLCPAGPLQLLIKTAKKRGEAIPAMIYNASVTIGMAEYQKEESSPSPPPPLPKNLVKDTDAPHLKDTFFNESPTVFEKNIDDKHSEISDDFSAVKAPKGGKLRLGLGDFVFYGVLISRAAFYEMATVFTCYVAIITGLFLTLFLLTVLKRALPALPMSIGLGILFYFLTYRFLIPFITFLGEAQVFI
ncbi:hypothetical protein CYY_008306 [Polysphondylium violaceum]|uniref:Presenilin n=1 Tax=Polysphondylium violaceum TaxID=133409 RepID=A0A8J4PLV6_9MYCE|nr:hypothetical protein CYY_008306 [Polysphondylium violaceum]